MDLWGQMLCQAGTGGGISTVEIVVCAVGAVVLIVWQIRTAGLSSLDNSPVRRNRLGLIFPILQMMFWLVCIGMAQKLIDKVIPADHLVERQYAGYLSAAGIELCLIVLCLSVSQPAFVRGLKGLGLNLRNAPKDLLRAAINLTAAYPLILAALWATIGAGKLLYGPDFSIQPHQSLQELTGCSDMRLKFLIVFFAVAVTPFFEELLFRGMLQSAVRGYVENPWAAIFAVSVPFVLMHPTATHWPALFVLSICLGYAYERSGSLMRAVFIHAFFNAANIATLLMS